MADSKTAMKEMLKKSMGNLQKEADSLKDNNKAFKKDIVIINDSEDLLKEEKQDNLELQNNNKEYIEEITENNNQIQLKKEEDDQKNNEQEENNNQENQEDNLNGNNQIQEQQKEPIQVDTSNVVVTYNNPMQNLITSYNGILKKIADEESEVLSGFRKRPSQADVYANATIQVRRDLYALLNEYIVDMRLGKTKILNEIFMLGINAFINKYSKVNKTPN